MATSLLFMATDQPSNHEEQQAMKPLSGSSEETRNEPGRIRGRKGNVKGPKKQPQRGLGVAQLERLRIQECWKKMSESSSSSGVPTTTFPDHHHHHQHHNFLQCHPQMLPFAVHDPFGNTSGSGSSAGGIPVRYGASSAPNHVHGGGFQCPQQVIHGNTVGVITGHGTFMGNKSTGLSVGSGGGSVGGWVVPNTQPHRVGSCGSGAPLWSPLVGTPLETSRELSSMPNLHSELECFGVCLKRTRFNEDGAKGSNARKDKPLDIWPNGPDFLGYSPQPAAPNLDGEARDFYNKSARHDDAAADATHSLDEGVEVVAVHRKGNSMSGRVFMEYEFFPGKDGRGTASKELELPTIGSVVAVAGEASSITVATAYRNTANCNNIDLSLKLSR